MKLLTIALVLILGFSFSACHKGPSCPAYKTVGNNPFAGTPDDEADSNMSNKDKVEKKKKEQLSRKNNRKGKSSLFPKSFGVKSR